MKLKKTNNMQLTPECKEKNIKTTIQLAENMDKLLKIIKEHQKDHAIMIETRPSGDGKATNLFITMYDRNDVKVGLSGAVKEATLYINKL